MGLGIKRPKVSFVVPVRNGQKTISNTLASIFEQSEKNFEVIVVDNQSFDETTKVVKRFKNVKILSCSKIGRGSARNCGAASAKGDYLAFVDCDVVLDRHWLRNTLAAMQELKIDVAATKVMPVGDQTTLTDRYRYLWANWRSKGRFISLQNREKARVVVNAAAFLISKTAFLKVSGFNESLKRFEDTELSRRLFANSFLIGGVSKAKATVQFECERSGLFAREIAYLGRQVEVAKESPTPKSLIRYPEWRFIGQILSSEEDLNLKIYAALVEVSDLFGLALNLSRPKRKRWRFESWQPKIGPGTLRYSFDYKKRKYALRPGASFIWIDDDVFGFQRKMTGEKLSPQLKKCVRGVREGRPIDASSFSKLKKTGFFIEI